MPNTKRTAALAIHAGAQTPPVNLHLARFADLAARGGCYHAGEVGSFLVDERIYSIPRMLYRGQGERQPVRIGIFTGVGGNLEGGLALLHFLESLREHPWRAAGYELSLYPLCNPTGHEDGRRVSRRDAALHDEFWRDSKEPEVMLLERELLDQDFHGVVVLHTGEPGSERLIGSGSGRFAGRLLDSALWSSQWILGSEAEERPWPSGALSSPPERHPHAFSLRLGTPAQVPMQLRIAVLDSALGAVLASARHYVDP